MYSADGSKLLREIKDTPKESGLQRAVWDLRAETPVQRKPPTEEEGEFARGPRGPQVLPGTYLVKLAVAGKTLEKPVEVHLDPTLSVSREDLERQASYASKLASMQSEGNQTLKTLDSLKAQLERTKTLMKERGMENAALNAQIDKWVLDIQNTIALLGNALDASLLEAAPRVIEEIGELFREIDSGDAGPTTAEMAAATDLEKEFHEKLPLARQFLSSSVPQWNAELTKAGGPSLLVGN